MDAVLYGRARRLMLLAQDAGSWNEQTQDRGEWYERKWGMTDAHIRSHLTMVVWIACRLPRDGMTDRLVIDVDAKVAEHVERRDRIYAALRELLGRDRPCLVWGTPSGYGVRLAYRIPRTPMRELAISDRRGLVPDVLRAAGLDPGPGTVEVYPAAHRCDRQLFGRRMPLLDAETLTPIPGADLGEEYCEARLHRAVELAEGWYGDVDHTLVPHLQRLPRISLPSGAASGGPEPEFCGPRGLSPGAETIRLAREGLTEPHSRYQLEFRLGQNMWLWPELFADLGVPKMPERQDIAQGLATWLATRANGHSRDWAASERRYGREGAIRWWTERYLTRNSTDGLAPVDRMRRKALTLNPDAWPTVHLTPGEHQEVLRVAQSARWSRMLRSGVDLYRAEVWACTCLRRAKGQIRRGGEAQRGDRLRVELAAEWMEGWPWGRQYVRYREVLERAGMLVPVEEHRWSTRRDVAGKATVYEIREPDWWRCGDLPIGVERVKEAIEPIRVAGRAASVDEAYHALHLADAGIDPVRRYGRSTAGIVRVYQHALRPAPFG